MRQWDIFVEYNFPIFPTPSPRGLPPPRGAQFSSVTHGAERSINLPGLTAEGGEEDKEGGKEGEGDKEEEKNKEEKDKKKEKETKKKEKKEMETKEEDLLASDTVFTPEPLSALITYLTPQVPLLQTHPIWAPKQ